ncbi:MAG: hypothetical protein ACTHN0_12025 [Aquihabitans sp.]
MGARRVTKTGLAGAVVAMGWLAWPDAAFAEGAPAPARGSSTGEIVGASAVALVGVVLACALAYAHRRHRVLDRVAATVERLTHRPAWSAIPSMTAGASLLIAVFGYYWDVSWHIDRGRDPGAFANPAHWFIIIGLSGIAFSGLLAMTLGDDRSPYAVRIRPHWPVPVGGILLSLCGLVALAGFPLDDIWHRIFGQDVTAWGPTHVQMIGGASLATLAIWVLDREGARAFGDDGSERTFPVVAFDVIAGGAFLVGLSTLQVEFDFGVPQFQQVFQPFLIALAAGIALVAVRLRGGPGTALGAVLMFLALRVTLTVLIAPVLGRSTQHIPLYVAEALVVEAVAWFVGEERQITVGVLAGAGIGTVGLASEWAWSHVWMPLPWGASLVPVGIVAGLAGGLAGGVIGSFIGRALQSARVPRQATPRGLAFAAWAVVLIGLAAPMRPGVVDARMQVAVGPEQDGRAPVSLTLDPPDAADDAHWFHVLAWQGSTKGDGGLEIVDLRRTGPGRWTTVRDVPVSGPSKTLVRLHTGSAMAGAPIYLPADPAIPAEAVPARSGTVELVREKSILQREATGGTPALERTAYLLLAAIGAAWLLGMGWGLRRLEHPPEDRPHRTWPKAERRPDGIGAPASQAFTS